MSGGAASVFTVSGWGSGGSGGTDLSRIDVPAGGAGPAGQGQGWEDVDELEGDEDGEEEVGGGQMEGPSRIPMSIRGEQVGPGGFGHIVSVERGILAGKMMR